MASYKRSSNVIVKQAGEELVVLHSKTGDYYTLNSLGKKIWDFCTDPKSQDEIVRFVASEHGAPPETAKKDVSLYLESLVLENIFEEIAP